MRHYQHTKSDIKIKGTELEAFYKENPTALFWMATGWGDRQLIKNPTKGWYIQHAYQAPSYFSKHQIDIIPEITVYIPPKN